MTKITSVLLILLLVSASSISAQSPLSNVDDSIKMNPAAATVQAERYVAPYFRSLEYASGHSGSRFQIVNVSNTTCEVTTEWYQQTTKICTITESLAPGNLTNHCSRSISGWHVEVCLQVCDPELTTQQGYVKILSTDNTQCRKIAVDGALIYTNSDDTAIVAIGSLDVISLSSQKRAVVLPLFE